MGSDFPSAPPAPPIAYPLPGMTHPVHPIHPYPPSNLLKLKVETDFIEILSNLGMSYPGHMPRPHYPHHPGHHTGHGSPHHPGYIPGPPPPPPYSPTPYPGHRYPYIQSRKTNNFMR